MKKKQKGSQSLDSGNDGFLPSTFWELISSSILPFYHFFSVGDFFFLLLGFLISHFTFSLVVACTFFLGFLRHFLLAVFPIKSLPLTFDGSKKRKFSALSQDDTGLFFLFTDLRLCDPSLVRAKSNLFFQSNLELSDSTQHFPYFSPFEFIVNANTAGG